MTCSCINGYGPMLNNYGPMLNGAFGFGSGLSGVHHFAGSGLGQIDPVTLTAAITQAANLWQQLKSALGIDAGSSEANVIVPVQNKVVAGVITPVANFLTTVNNGTVVPTCAQLQQYLAELKAAQAQWLNFLHGTTWKDGRAAQQAEATLAPYFTNGTNDLTKYIGQYCGVSSGITSIFTNPTTGQTNWGTIGLIGVAAYFFLKK